MLSSNARMSIIYKQSLYGKHKTVVIEDYAKTKTDSN